VLGRLIGRAGRAAGFSPEGRPVRVWTHSRPGEEDAVVVLGTVAELTREGAVVALSEPVELEGEEVRQVIAVPAERSWGLHALWFSFVAVEASSLDGRPIGRWWLRLGRGA
jgi:hypothetical protein